MYHHIRGKLYAKGPAFAVVEAGGVGYELKIPLSTYQALPEPGAAEVLVYTFFSVSENNQALFGFATEKEREVFAALNRINGIGPSTALSILSSASAEVVIDAVVRGDVAALKKLKGIGPKSAQRIILEMRGTLPEDFLAKTAAGMSAAGRRDKDLSAPVSDGLPANISDAVEGIMNLFELKREKAVAVVRKVAGRSGKETPTEDLIRAAIKELR